MVFRRSGNAELREPKMGALQLPYETMPLRSWPEFPLVQENGVWFVLAREYTVKGLPESAALYLDYCVLNGVFQTKAYTVPTAESASAALDSLEKSSRWQEIDWKPFSASYAAFVLEDLRKQANFR
jgi:hypothetical protein